MIRYRCMYTSSVDPTIKDSLNEKLLVVLVHNIIVAKLQNASAVSASDRSILNFAMCVMHRSRVSYVLAGELQGRNRDGGEHETVGKTSPGYLRPSKHYENIEVVFVIPTVHRSPSARRYTSIRPCFLCLCCWCYGISTASTLRHLYFDSLLVVSAMSWIPRQLAPLGGCGQGTSTTLLSKT